MPGGRSFALARDVIFFGMDLLWTSRLQLPRGMVFLPVPRPRQAVGTDAGKLAHSALVDLCCGEGKLVVRAGIAGVQCNRPAQGGNRLCDVALEKQSFSQVIKCVRILCIHFSGAAQVENCGFPVAGFQLSMPELEKDIRVWRRTRKLFLIFNYGLVIFSQTRVCKAEMVMA